MKSENLNANGYIDQFRARLREDWFVQEHVKLKDVREGWKIFMEALWRCVKNVCRVKSLSDEGVRKGSE